MASIIFTAPQGKQEVIVSRVFNAPQEHVFKIVTDPLLIDQWWGPDSLTTRVHKMVVTTGGSWRILQWDQEGREHGFHGIYHEVIKPERLVYTMEYEGFPGHATLVIDNFSSNDRETLMISKTIFQSVEDRDQMLQWEMEAGTIETTNRLNDLIKKCEFTNEFEKVAQFE